VYGLFVDVIVENEFYFACKTVVYILEIGEVAILINVKTGIDDVHFLCSDLIELFFFEFLEAGS
jgi:hypothetical protein